MLKRHRSRVESLPHDVVELILERLPVKSLLRFKSVSKTWKSTVETRPFQEKQLIRRKQSRGPEVLLMSFAGQGPNTRPTRFVYGSSIAYTVWLPTLYRSVCYGTCDGLVCLYDPPECGVMVANPATRWHQSFPLAKIQHLLIQWSIQGFAVSSMPKLGFGKDKHIGTYKPVFLYNSSGFGLDNVTTCEVLDVSTNAWRYVRPASPYRININHDPVYLDGSLYWLTESDHETRFKVLSFDLHTETFQVICEAPIANVFYASKVCMGILDNNLCVSENNMFTIQIWSLDASDGNIKTWRKLHSIEFTKSLYWLGAPHLPIQILDKTKLLLGSHESMQQMMIYDHYAKSYELLLRPTKPVGCFFESLFSTLSN